MAQALRGVSRDTTMVDDREEPEEKIEKFDEFGQALEGYISLEQARVLAIQHARDNRDFYGGRYRDRDLVWEVASADEGEDYYEIRLSYRPAGRFRGEPGLEQFTIDKTGSIELRQILDEPRARRSISMLVLAIVGVVVIAGAAGGVLFASGALGGGDGESAPEAPAPEVLASTPTVQPLAQAAVVGPTPTGGAPAAVPAAGECTTRAEAESLMDSVTPAIDAWKAQGSLPPRVGEILVQLGDPAVLIQQGEFQAACAMLEEIRAEFEAAGPAPAPGVGGMDEVKVGLIDPPDGAEVIVGTTLFVKAEIGFGLTSQGSGEVALLVQVADQRHDTFASVTVGLEDGGVTVEGSFVVPDRSATEILVHLRRADGAVLAQVRAATYKIVQQPLGPVVAGADHLEVSSIEPPSGTPLEPGTVVRIIAKVAYIFQSQPSGFVQLGYREPGGGFSQIAEQQVGRGSDEREIVFDASLTVPDQPTIRLFVSLAGADGGPIRTIEVAAYPRAELPPGPASNGRQGGVLRIALGGDPAPNGGFDYYTRPSSRLLQAISPAFNGLVEQDTQDPSSIVPGLAASWEISSDGAGWTFTLRQGVTFHNGSSLDAGDVALTLEYILTNASSVVREDLARMVAKWDVRDDRTLFVILNQPFAAFLPVLGQGFMNVYPSEVMREALDSGFPTDPRVALTGTGPFRFSVYAPGEKLAYERWPAYFVTDRPYLDQLDMFIIPNGDRRMAALLTGQIDLSLERLTPKESAGLANQGFTVSTGPLLLVRTVDFNTQAGPWREPPVRRAASVAIDRAAIREVLLGGQGSGGYYMPPWGPWASESVLYDPERAKALLAEAGFPDGFKTTMTVSQFADRLNVAEIVAEMWSQFGIETEVEITEFATWAARIRAGEYSTSIGGSAFAVDDPDVILRRLYASDGAANFTGFSSPLFDRLLEMQSTMADPQERRGIVAEMQSILADLSPSAVVYWDDMRQGVSPDIKDYFLPQSLRSRVNFASVWLDR